ncbi:unnamed protein product [Somion occarium]|uniref:Uncharacterized protein n=1 Tax=Somion occarium TaxID=3059160 RepID=A0ABP1DPU9_9APHY
MRALFGKKPKVKNLTHSRRAPSPPSPGSFTSPEADLHGEGSSLNSSNDPYAGPSRSNDSVLGLRVPPLQLDFESRESLSEWFPAGLLKVGEVLANPPNRDASLRAPESASNSRNEVVRPPWNASREVFNFSTDEIIVIEAERPPEPPQADPPAETTETSNAELHSPQLDSPAGHGASRRPVPNPIQIPFNPTSSRVRVHRSPSVGAIPTRDTSASSLAASRPNSSYSDDYSSAVSGTTLARDLVAGSFIISGGSRDSRWFTLTRQDSATLPKGEHPFLQRSSSYWKDKRISNGEVIVSPEYALGSPVPPVPPMPSSAELSAMGLDSACSSQPNSRRRNSIAGEEVVSAHEKDIEQSGEQTENVEGAGFIPKHRRANSLSRISKDQLPVNPKRFSIISEASSSAVTSPVTPAKSTYSVAKTVRSLRQSYRNSGRTQSENDVRQQKSSSSLSLVHTEPHPTEDEPRSSSETANDSSSTHPTTGGMTDATVFSPDPPTTAESGSMYSVDSTSKRSYTTPATSIKSPGSGSLYPASMTSMGSPRLFHRSPSEPSSHRSSGQHRPTITVPYGDRPHSVQVPYTASPLSSRTSEESMRDTRLPFRPRPSPGPSSTVESPDLIEQMFGGIVQPVRNPSSRKRSGSQPAPMIFSPDLTSPEQSFSSESPSTSSAARQTFPETPYLFTPYTSSAFAQPPLPAGAAHLASPRMGSLNRGVGRTPLSSGQIFRHMSVSVASSSASSTGSRSARLPMSPPMHSAAGSVHSIFSDPGSWSMASEASGMPSALLPLGAIEEGSAPPTPLTQTHTSRSRTSSPPPDTNQGQMVTVSASPQPSPQLMPPPPSTRAATSTTTLSLEATTESSPSLRSTAPDSRPVSTVNLSRPTSLVPSKRALSPMPPPSPSTSSARLSPAPSHVSHASELLGILSEPSPVREDPGPLPPYFERGAQPPPPPEQLPPPYLAAATPEPRPSSRRTPSPLPQPPQPPQPTPPSESVPLPRATRTLARPAAPMGPRRPSGPALLSVATNRARAGSVSSTSSVPAGRPVPSRIPSAPLSATSPKFQITPIRFRGLTMEAAQWTLTSHQLQEIVSTAIRSSADATAIRLLPIDVLNDQVPAEIERLETLSAELRTQYKVTVRKRKTRLDDLSAIAGGEFIDQTAVFRMVQELGDIGEYMDHLSEELYDVTQQLTQLKHLQDIHSSSALAMALRKLNTSLVKHMADNKSLREQITSLEMQRDEGWEKAAEVAMELEEMQERMVENGMTSPSSYKEANGRPSSRINLARKTSLRVSKSGLRSPSRLRSQRSSVASSLHRSSTAGSPALRSASEVPPVPRLPIRTPLGIVTNDLPARSAGITSADVTPTSEVRAMVEAQKEVMDLLGISLDNLQDGNVRGSLPRRRSLSAVATGSVPPRTRRNSDIRSAVLAAIGMSPLEC